MEAKQEAFANWRQGLRETIFQNRPFRGISFAIMYAEW